MSDKFPEGVSRHHFPESSNIHTIGHCPKENCLYVEFKNGGVYAYDDAPATLFHEFKDAKSAGGFFYSNVRHKLQGRRI
jgi:hypothetical protein